jgi:PAS domain S-box-containing protein
MLEQAPTIVVVDDATEVRLLVKTRLRLSGLEVVGEAADGAEAVRLARRLRPSLMLLDVSMSDTDGLEALPAVLQASPDTQVVLYSGFEEQGLVEKARQLGAAAFVAKSAPLGTLVQRLLALVEREPGRSGAEQPALREPAAGPQPDTALDPGVLQEHLERFHQVFEEAAIGMSTMTLTGRLVRVNRALAAVLDRSPTDLTGAYYRDLIDTGRDDVTAALQQLRAGHADVVQLEHRLAGPDRPQVRAILAAVRDSSRRALYVFLQVQNITAEREAIEELRQSEERFRLLVEAVQDYAIFMLDTDGHIVSWNAGAQRTKGYRADEIIGQHFRIFYPPEVAARKHPEYELAVAVREGQYEEEGWRLRKDGSRFWANVLITAVFNDRGKHIGFTKVTRDNTERRRLEQERERAVEALAAANTELESLNKRLRSAAEGQAEFLAMTAHELRTPIGIIGGSAETLSRHWDALGDEDRSELLGAMTSSSARLRRLLADLLTASRLQARALEVNTEPVPVSAVIEDAVATVRRTWPEAELVSEVAPDVVINVDRDRLAQAVDNLLSNAVRHGAPPVRVEASRRPDRGVELRVSDQGSGVAEAMRPRLFERFATGRRRGGTGLGLFIVRELARAHGGDAFYEPPSEESPAGAFVIRLPDGSSEAPSVVPATNP